MSQPVICGYVVAVFDTQPEEPGPCSSGVEVELIASVVISGSCRVSHVPGVLPRIGVDRRDLRARRAVDGVIEERDGLDLARWGCAPRC